MPRPLLRLHLMNVVVCCRYEQLDFTPFDPATKYTAGTLKGPDGKVFKVIKGAPQVILKMCGCGDQPAACALSSACGLHAGKLIVQ